MISNDLVSKYCKQTTDLVLIHTCNRSAHIYPQIKSLIESHRPEACMCNLKHHFTFLIVDDSESRQTIEENVTQVKRVQKFAEDYGYSSMVSIMYVDKAIQISTIGHSRLPADMYTDFFTDKVKNKIGGMRGIQNLSLLISELLFRLHSNLEDLIVHRLDDDVFPYVVEGVNNEISIKRQIGIFCKKRKYFELNKNSRILGCNYNWDSPSVLKDFTTSLKALSIYINGDFDQNNENICLNNKIVKHELPTDLSNLAHLENSLTHKPNLSAFIHQNIQLLDKGINRFTANTSNIAKHMNWYGDRKTIPGGFISFRATERVLLFPWFGAQDMIWSKEEANLDGGVIGHENIMHIKTGISRQSLHQSLLNENVAIERSDYPVTYHVLNILQEPSLSPITDDKVNNLGALRPEEILTMLKDISRKLTEKKVLDPNQITQRYITHFIRNFNTINRKLDRTSAVDQNKVKSEFEKWQKLSFSLRGKAMLK